MATSGPTIKAVITTLDNRFLLEEQLHILENDPLIDEIIVVNNGSKDGTKEWLDNLGTSTAHHGTGDPLFRDAPIRSGNPLTIIHRENLGAGPGRNAGLDRAGECDYLLMLDGGIRPLIGGTERMLDYLQRTPMADVIGVEIPHFETDVKKAWRRWPRPIKDFPIGTYQNTRLSHTAYCLARFRAFDGLRFCEEGSFAKPGWGVDDDEMMYQWNEAGIIMHVVTNVKPYRRGSGSFRRLFEETGVWPNQYGSTYEERLVWCQQNWAQYNPGVQWGEPWLQVVIKVGDDSGIKLIKHAHDELRKRRFAPPWDYAWNPYHLIAWMPEHCEIFSQWAEVHRLRQHHGDVVAHNGNLIRRDARNEETWTGDFRLWLGLDWREALRPTMGYCGLVSNEQELDTLLGTYNEVYPNPKATERFPVVYLEELGRGSS